MVRMTCQSKESSIKPNPYTGVSNKRVMIHVNGECTYGTRETAVECPVPKSESSVIIPEVAVFQEQRNFIRIQTPYDLRECNASDPCMNISSGDCTLVWSGYTIVLIISTDE